MALVTVDDALCTRCGACVRACPARVLVMADAEALPETTADAELRCVRCGHCVTLCHRGALAHADMLPGECRTLNEGWRLTPVQVEDLLKGRRSVRAYSARSVDRKVLEQVIDIARYAPSGTNSQPVRWLVIHDPAETWKAAKAVAEWFRGLVASGSPMAGSYRADIIVRDWDAGVDPILRSAPHVVIAYAAKDNPIAANACTLAMGQFELAALPFGLGTCWAGFLMMAAGASPAVREALGVPEGCTAYAAAMVGYPRHPWYRVPVRKPANITWR